MSGRPQGDLVPPHPEGAQLGGGGDISQRPLKGAGELGREPISARFLSGLSVLGKE